MKPIYNVVYAVTDQAQLPSANKFTNYTQAMHMYDTLSGCTLVQYAYVTEITDRGITTIIDYVKED